MDAVLRIDHEPRTGFLHVIGIDNFINPDRAIKPRRFSVLGQIAGDRDRRVLQLQMDRLIFFVVGVLQKHGGGLVETEFAVGLGIGDRLHVGELLQAGIVGLAVAQRAERRKAEQ